MINRDYYRIDQAAELSKHTVDDLIHFGAVGTLPIYVLTGGCYPKIIVELKPEDIASGPIYDFTNFIAADSGDKDSMYRKLLYKPQRLTTKCLLLYEQDSDKVEAQLEEDSPDGIYRIFYPDPSIYLSSDNMVVMAADLPLLTGETADKPLGTKERNGLYAIMGALLKEAEIDVSEPYKAAEILANLLSDAEGKPKVGSETIAKHLKNIRDLL